MASLQRVGFDARNVKGGMIAWSRAGLEVTKGSRGCRQWWWLSRSPSPHAAVPTPPRRRSSAPEDAARPLPMSLAQRNWLDGLAIGFFTVSTFALLWVIMRELDLLDQLRTYLALRK